MQELDKILRKIKAGKAAGSDNIRAEMLKELPTSAKEYLLEICNKAWNSQSIPDDWSNAIILPIHKKGSTTDCHNYRGISLLSVGAKVYEGILEARLRNAIDSKLQQEQSGFRMGHSTQDHIFTLNQLIEKALAKGRTLYLAFIDTEKAFDKIRRDSIWKSLESKGVDKKLIAAIKSMYKTTSNQIRSQNKLSEKFYTNEGVRQGSGLSPLLFLSAIDEVVKRCKHEFKKYYVGYYNLRPINAEICLFADDVALMADSEEKLQYNLEVWSRTATQQGLNINTTKTQVMKISIGEESSNGMSITVDGRSLKEAKQYKYLGVVLNDRGTYENEMNSRFEAANRVFYMINNRRFLRNDNISETTKLTVYKKIYLPILLYGAENWILNERQRKRVAAAQMKYLRRVANIKLTDKIRSSVIREQLKMRHVQQDIDKKKLQWLGHLIRMPDNMPTKIAWKTRGHGKTRRGRPRKTWDTEMAETLRGRNVTWAEAQMRARNRQEWRDFIND